ncbi:MAG: hypothetical protein LZF60_280043 [Nitrospira sp.]|nr:MAG: hypothetical protein LZF60_280043 [Nitrospira sp.]
MSKFRACLRVFPSWSGLGLRRLIPAQHHKLTFRPPVVLLLTRLCLPEYRVHRMVSCWVMWLV